VRNLQKREKILLAAVGLTAVFFVFDQFVCGEKAQRPEITKKSVKETTKPANSDAIKAKVKSQVGHSQKKGCALPVEYTSWRRDPFAEAIRLARSDSTKRDSSNFVLKGLIWKGEEAYVLIGDDILKSGEQKGDLKILDIDRNRVICRKGGKIVTLVLEGNAVF
jgi:hypothetical protein